MSLAVRRAASVAAVLVCALPAATAHAQKRADTLVAQIAQATPAPTPSDEPPLTPSPPQPLGTATPTASPSASATPSGAATTLARTGSDARLVALAGLSLLGVGLGLRWVAGDGAAV